MSGLIDLLHLVLQSLVNYFWNVSLNSEVVKQENDAKISVIFTTLEISYSTAEHW